MYEGFLSVSGVEIVNAERVEAYVKNVGDGIGLRAVYNTEKIHLAVEDDEYRSPLIDDAPWVNPLDLVSTEFLGFYPLEITGLGDSTMAAEVTEHLDDGASFGIQRDSSRAIRVHGLIVAASQLGAEYGLSWLNDAVRASECSMLTSCGGGDLTYFAAEPDVCDGVFGDEQEDPDVRSFGSLIEPGLISYRWPSDTIKTSMPSRASWAGSYVEGTRFRFGAMERRSAAVLQDSGVIAPIRRNYVQRARLESGADGWTTGVGTVLDWQPGPGAVDDGFARCTQKVDGFGVQPLGSSTFGDGDSSAYLGTYLTVSSVSAAMPAGTATVSAYVRGDVVPIALAVSDPDGNLLGGSSVVSEGEWQRVSVTVTLDEQVPLTVELSAGLPFDFDAVLAEVGSDVLSFFDGSTSNEEYRGSWDGEPGNSTSSAIWLGSTEIIRPDSNWRPFFRLTDGQVLNLQLTSFRRDEITIHEQLLPYERTLHDVTCTQGPQVIARYATSVGHFIEVDLIVVAGDPHPYSNPVSVPTFPVTSQPYTDPDDQPDLDDAWLADPDSVAITAPTRAPVILDTSVQTFTDWQRYYVEVPAATVRQWGMSVPTIGITTKGVAVKQVRVRFHPNPFGYPAQQVDPLNFCSEFVISYLPSQTRLVVDGLTQSAIASKGGYATVPADHLLFGGADGAPISWPELTCGIGYVMTLDVPTSSVKDLFDVDLVMRARG